MRVLDLTRLLPGPLATYILCHLGAEVIKVEDPQGDPTRFAPPHTEGGRSALFSFLNAGKKSVVINLKKEEGRRVLFDLVRTADVLIEGFRPSVTRKLGIDFESVRRVKPDIIYCSISGYGQTGPRSELPGHDLNYVSFAGLQWYFGEVVPPFQIADISGALFAVIGILSALFERERAVREGKRWEGKHIDVAMSETPLFFAVDSLSKFLATGYQPEPRKDVLTGGVVCYNVFWTKDRKLVSIGALETKFWKNLCGALGLDFGEFDGLTPADESNPVWRELKRKIGSMTADELEKILRDADVPFEKVKNYKEFFSDEHTKSRDIVYQVGDTKLLRLPFMGKVGGPAPELGQDTRKVLRDIGYTDERIRQLAESGVIFVAG